MSSARVGHLLAITGEALSNVVRHAGATRVTVSAISSDGQLKLKIQDNGQGLPNDYLQGFGLKNMHERTRLLGGEMSIESRKNFGTIISVEVPWSEENEYITVDNS
jgi:signal transduction histidine kinase